MVKVGYLGPPGTYSHQAAIQKFPHDELIPQRSISECFKSLDKQLVEYSVIPFENSSNGQVVFTYDLLRDWFMKCGDSTPEPHFSVIGETFVGIHHNLIGFAQKSEITKIMSHPQVWGQCTKFLGGFADAERFDTPSTSRAVELVSQMPPEEQKTVVAIGSMAASKLHGVPVICESIEDNKNNTTRFLVLGEQQTAMDSDKQQVSLVSFVLKHFNDSGSLCRVLSVFDKYFINLVSITTRPAKLNMWQYVFFVECTTTAGPLQSAFKELETLTEELRLMGTFLRST